MVSSSAVGLIAGSGRLPEILAEAVSAQGRPLIVLALDGASSGAVSLAQHRYDVGYGDVQRILAVLQTHRVREVVFAGGVPRIPPLDRADPALLEFLAAGGEAPGQSMFRRGIDLLAGLGIQVRGPLDLRPDLATPGGVLTARGPTSAQQDDIHRGMTIARLLAGEEIGQTVAVARGVVLAVEAAEGTDETIHRAGAHAAGTVVVKMARPDQDVRFDLPTAGVDTIEAMRRSRASVLALEAGRTLLLDRETAVAAADDAGIAIVGITLSGSGVRGQGSGN